MKKFLVTALAAGACLGVAATSWADIGASTKGKAPAAGANGVVKAPLIAFATEAWGAAAVYHIPEITTMQFDSLKFGSNWKETEITVTATFPEDFKILSIDTAKKPVAHFAIFDSSGTFVGNVPSNHGGNVEGKLTLTGTGFQTTWKLDKNALCYMVQYYTGALPGAPTEMSKGHKWIEFRDPSTYPQYDCGKAGESGNFAQEALDGWSYGAAGGSDANNNAEIASIEGLQNLKFVDQTGVLSNRGSQVMAATVTVTVDGDGDTKGDETSVLFAVADSFLGNRTFTGDQSVVVDAKSKALEFLGTGTTAHLGQWILSTNPTTNVSGHTVTLSMSDGDFPMTSANFKVKLEITPSGDEFPEAITGMWLDMNGNYTKDSGEELSFSKDIASIEVNMDQVMAGKDGVGLYADVDGATILPYYYEFNAVTSITGSTGDLLYSGATETKPTWTFNGTILQIPRFEIKGAKCNATLTNTSGKEVPYISEFFTTEKGAGGTITEGDMVTGTIPASGTLNIPCNKIIKKVKGNQGTLQFVVMEDPNYISGTYQATKGSSVSNDAMTYKWTH